MTPLVVPELELELDPATMELLDAKEPVTGLTVGDAAPLLVLGTELDPVTLELLDTEESVAV